MLFLSLANLPDMLSPLLMSLLQGLMSELWLLINSSAFGLPIEKRRPFAADPHHNLPQPAPDCSESSRMMVQVRRRDCK